MHRSNTVQSVPRWSALSFAAFTLVLSRFVLAGPLAVGPIDHIDYRTGNVSVLGQSFPLAPDATSQLHLGQLLWLDGQIDSKGDKAATTAYMLPELNVPGETRLYVAGFVSKVSSTGSLVVGRLRIDFTGLLFSDASISVAAGDFVQVFGTQPSSRGVLLADDLQVVSRIVGTGTLGIVGTGTQGIVGTGTLGIVGTGTQGIVGTGTLGIVGTGTLGIVGTGIQ